MATKIDSHHRIGQWVCITLINRNRLLLILLLMSMMLLPLLLMMMMMMPLLLLFDYAFTWVPNEFTTLISYQFPLWCSIKKFIRDTNKHALALMRFANLAWINIRIDRLIVLFVHFSVSHSFTQLRVLFSLCDFCHWPLLFVLLPFSE